MHPKIFLNRNAVLIVIFLTAMVLRIGLNWARKELFFCTPFFVSMGTIDNRTPSDAIWHSVDDRISCDATWYICTAKAFMDGKGVVSRKISNMPIAWQKEKKFIASHKKLNEEYFAHKNISPAYSLFLALCFYIGGVNTVAYFIPQLILSALTCILVYLLAEEFFGRAVALFSGFTLAFYPDLIFWSSFARTETLFIFLFVLGFWLLLKGNTERNLFLVYGSAAIFGLACLTRITLIPFIPVIILWQAYFSSDNRKENFRTALLMGIIIGVVLMPWAVRNYVLFGEFTVFSEEARILVGSVENGEQYKDVEINKQYEAHKTLIMEVFVFIKDNFRIYMESCWRRFVLFWSPFTYVMKPWAKIYKGLTWLIIFPAAFWGMIISRKKWKKGTYLIVAFVFYYALLHAGSFMDLGLVYRYPIQPFLCIFAGYVYCKIYGSIAGRSKTINNT